MKNWLVLLVLTLTGCVAVPDGVQPVTGFELQRYLGTWYEVARLDHSFERGLSRVTAEYRLRDDGGVQVINRGYDAESGEWEQAEGRAYFVRDPQEGYLKVSFFRPFYGAYVVLALDTQHYEYALVSGPNRDYLWILARRPDLDQATVEALVSKAAALGFDTQALIYVDHPG